MTNDVHVLPIDDLKPHIESDTCECKPLVEIQDNGVAVVVHHAWDKREFDEPDSRESKLN